MNFIFSDVLNINKNFKDSNKYIVIIGAFDGVHLGHKKLLEVASDYNKNRKCKILILTFYSSFINVSLKKYSSVIFKNKERLCIFKELNETFRIDDVLFLKLNKKFISLSGDTFLNIVKQSINIDSIVVGEDFRYGNNRKGNIKRRISKYKNYPWK